MSKPYYSAFNVELYHGDCLEILPQMRQTFGCFVTDPPYTAAGGSTNGRSSSADGQFFRFWLSAVCAQIRRVMQPQGCGFVFCDWRTVGSVAECMREPGDRTDFGGAPWSVSQAFCWDRESMGMGAPFRNAFEMIAFARGPAFESKLPKTITTVLRHRWPYGAKPHHGAEKPVPLVKQLVEWASLHGTPLLDPFAGGGTTLIAAREAGGVVPVIGIEIEERNCETIARRIEQAATQGRLGLGDVA